jgi:hypothetical protein
MKAFLANAYGGPEVMTLGDMPEPCRVRARWW